MRLRRSFFDSQLILVLNIITNYAWLLPSPWRISMESVNMRHLLKWRRQQSPCSSIIYSVQFQGEFELRILNGSWEDAVGCQRVTRTECDLTFDLGSDSDYNIRVRAECGRRVSPWAELGRPFNRRETILTVPAITVTTMGDALQVTFKSLPLTVGVTVTIWKRGELVRGKSSLRVITVQQNPLYIDALQEGAVYCVKAQAHLDTHSNSSSTDTQCVSITGPGPTWLKPTTVTVIVVILAGLVFFLSWSVTHCSPEACYAYFRKEPQPTALLLDWPLTRVKIYPQDELREPIHAVLLTEHQRGLSSSEPSSQLDKWTQSICSEGTDRPYQV
ncbi:interleukin-20 receptor subunit beta isoform 3-T6 [Salvelinus alpinus]|uniref:interleukin-20 receptor subunit beta n=1 Tax=Salvelinus alpinus TaxID=8036 RepID=UPI0039FBF6F5